MTYNTALADELIGLITANPKRHDNAVWISLRAVGSLPSSVRDDCGTTCCVAGWIAALTLDDSWTMQADRVINRSGVISYRLFGTKTLGITSLQAGWLFCGARTQEEVIWALKWLRDHQDATNDDLDANAPQGSISQIPVA